MALPGYLEDTGKDLAKQMTADIQYVPIDTGAKFTPSSCARRIKTQQDAINGAGNSRRWILCNLI